MKRCGLRRLDRRGQTRPDTRLSRSASCAVMRDDSPRSEFAIDPIQFLRGKCYRESVLKKSIFLKTVFQHPREFSPMFFQFRVLLVLAMRDSGSFILKRNE